MSSIYPKLSLRLALLGGAAAVVTASPAAAVTVNSLGLVGVAQQGPSVCVATLSWSITGVTNDAAGIDGFLYGHVTGSGNRNNAPGLGGVTVGQTQTTTTTAIGISPTQRNTYFGVIYESDAIGTQGAELARVAIPRSLLYTAGGACRGLVTNIAPTNSAGPDQTLGGGGGTANLAGTANDGDGDPLTNTWTQISGPTVTLSGANTLTPSFTAPAQTNQARTTVFRLTTTDGIGNPITDDVAVTIPAGPNTLPVANAGADRTLGGGPQASLLGSASDVDNDPLTYAWTQVSGTPVTFVTGPNIASPIFNVPASNGVAQPLVFQLVVNDGFGNSIPDTVTLTVPANAPPTVTAGPDQTRPAGSAVNLAGSASDLENNPLTYTWTQTAGPPVTLAGANTLSPSFTAPPKTGAAQVLTFSLVANDGTSNSAADTVDITIPANAGPAANASVDQTVNGGATVTLSGSTSIDGDGDALTYSWVQTGGPTVTLSNANVANPTFVAPLGGLAAQTLTFDLVVNDGLTTATDSVTITVNPNNPPVANAGPDQGPINTGQTITLNGGASTDPDGNPLTYQWSQVSGPTVTLSNPTSANPSFVAPSVTGTQNLVFQLVVNDGTVNSPPDTVVIAVRAVGTITVIQRVVGADGSFAYTSDVNALTGTIVTSGGIGQRSASLVPAGAHSLTAGDARAAGYALTAISCNDSDSVVNLAGRSVAIALSPNENLVCTFTSTNTRDAALLAISNFLTARNAALLANQPELQRRLDRLSGGDSSGGSATAYGMPVPGADRLPLSASITSDRARASTSLGTVRAAAGMDRSATPFDIWAEATFGSLDFDNKDGRFSVIYAGADYRLGNSLLVGGLVQFDRYSPQGARTAGTASGDGWMAGPYVTAKLAPNLYADVRAAWGTSDNTISPLGTYVDAFETSRSLYSASLIGQFNFGSATQFRPEIAIRHIDERQKAYLDNFGVPIPGQTVSQGDIAFRPRFHHDFTVSDGWTLRPFIAGDGIYTYGLERQTVFTDQFRMRIEGGMELFSSGSFRAGLSGFHDGIGSDNFKSTGGRVSVSFGF